MNSRLTPGDIRAFRKTVYAYFDHHGRDLPWRRTSQPYHILVSEIMLQQTQVDRVVGKFLAFIDKFPTVNDLAAASMNEVLSAWQGLGYNRRGMNLKRCAATLAESFGGKVPDSPDELVTLPGIGPATSRSIAAFAFDKPVVFIETNIRSVYLHHFFEDQSAISDAKLLPLVAQTLDKRQPRTWYSALMDYGVYLKKRYGNPSRRSVHHQTQSRFDGSDRQIRGEILRLLLKHTSRTRRQIVKHIGVRTERTERILYALVKDGLLVATEMRYYIGE
ncbi:MAG: A/G-specific adenine glycosylase [Chitinivibrionales bacterium]|nr:A/G-specific adenine glycosylase [Chitinivibrionales bacterium]